MVTKKVLEKDIERYLYSQCKKRGWLCEKFSSPARRSVPDRLITLPEGRMILVELKSLHGRLTPGQERDHMRRKTYGVSVIILHSKKMVDMLVSALEKTMRGGR